MAVWFGSTGQTLHCLHVLVAVLTINPMSLETTNLPDQLLLTVTVTENLPVYLINLESIPNLIYESSVVSVDKLIVRKWIHVH
jgi:hypothetical protein